MQHFACPIKFRIRIWISYLINKFSKNILKNILVGTYYNFTSTYLRLLNWAYWMKFSYRGELLCFFVWRDADMTWRIGCSTHIVVKIKKIKCNFFAKFIILAILSRYRKKRYLWNHPFSDSARSFLNFCSELKIKKVTFRFLLIEFE